MEARDQTGDRNGLAGTRKRVETRRAFDMGLPEVVSQGGESHDQATLRPEGK